MLGRFVPKIAFSSKAAFGPTESHFRGKYFPVRKMFSGYLVAPWKTG